MKKFLGLVFGGLALSGVLSGCFLVGLFGGADRGQAEKDSPLRPGVVYQLSSASKGFSEKVYWEKGAAIAPAAGGFTSAITQEHGETDGKYYTGGGYYVFVLNTGTTFGMIAFSKNKDRLQCTFEYNPNTSSLETGLIAKEKSADYTPAGGAKGNVADCTIKLAK